MSGVEDHGLDVLLDLNDQVFVVDPHGRYWVKFEVNRCEVTAARPHGIRYGLTLHGPRGERLVGFDNAHPVATGSGPAARSTKVDDHMHRGTRIHAYAYTDALTLLTDFWREVDAVLEQMGIPR